MQKQRWNLACARLKTFTIQTLSICTALSLKVTALMFCFVFKTAYYCCCGGGGFSFPCSNATRDVRNVAHLTVLRELFIVGNKKIQCFVWSYQRMNTD